METHQHRAFLVGQVFAVIEVVFGGFSMNYVVFLETLVHDEISAFTDDIFVVEVIENGCECSPVTIVSYTASIVAETSQVAQGLERHLVERVDHVVKLLHRNLEVGVVEVVISCPAKRTKAPPFSHDCVEKR